jgi:hypothetical protein
VPRVRGKAHGRESPAQPAAIRTWIEPRHWLIEAFQADKKPLEEV